MSDPQVGPWPTNAKLIIIKAEPGNEKVLYKTVRAFPNYEPCCEEHGGYQVVVNESDTTEIGEYPVRWMKPFFDDLDINEDDILAIRGLTTPNKSKAVTKTQRTIEQAMKRIANKYPKDLAARRKKLGG